MTDTMKIRVYIKDGKHKSVKNLTEYKLIQQKINSIYDSDKTPYYQKFTKEHKEFLDKHKLIINKWGKMTDRTLYLEKKYLGENAVVKAPIALPPLSPLPYQLKLQIINFEWKNTKTNYNPEWGVSHYNLLLSRSYSSIIGISNNFLINPKKFKYAGSYTTNRYFNKALKEIIDMQCSPLNPYYTNTTRKSDLWKIIMSYD